MSELTNLLKDVKVVDSTGVQTYTMEEIVKKKVPMKLKDKFIATFAAKIGVKPVLYINMNDYDKVEYANVGQQTALECFKALGATVN